MKRKPVALVDIPSWQSPEEPRKNRAYHDIIQLSLVGDVLDKAAPSSPGRVLVRWQTVDGIWDEGSLRVVRGLAIENGDLILLHRPANWPEWLVTNVIEGQQQSDIGNAKIGNANSTIQGRSIEIEAADEVTLRCGQASITLRRNGRVVIRGTYIESLSKGTNQIKGGSVLIN